MRVGIIGAGASGILCAIELKRKYGNQVIVDLFEQEDKIGKKILQTGNGKCNFTNTFLHEKFYNNPTFVKPIFDIYNVSYLLEYFNSLGILSKVDDQGRVYPLSESAASFLEILKWQLKTLGINIYLATKITSIKKTNDGYLLNGLYQEDKLVIAIGGKARVKEYNNDFLTNLGISITKDRPGLVSVRVKERFLKPISGVRMKVKAKVINGNDIVYENEGEVLFKDDSLSGIVIFSCSRYVKEGSVIELDLVKNQNESSLLCWMEQLNPNISLKEALLGLFPRQLALVITKELNYCDLSLNDLNLNERKKIIKMIKSFKFHFKAFNDYDTAQIMCGGINLEDVNEKLQLKTHPSIFVAGEILDIDGECGGFNLSFAWSSALFIANNIFSDCNHY